MCTDRAARARVARGGAGSPDHALGWLLACGVFFVLGLLSKENAVLLPLYLAVIELCLWR